MQSSLDVGVVAGGRDGGGGAAAADDGRRAVAGSQAGFAAEVRAGAALAAVPAAGPAPAVNACLRPLCALGGRQIVTTEGLGNARDG